MAKRKGSKILEDEETSDNTNGRKRTRLSSGNQDLSTHADPIDIPQHSGNDIDNNHAAEQMVLDQTTSEIDCSQRPDFEVQNEAEVGIIERITLQNFMCHKFLEINFGPNVNFIIGKNGSGKSAIMTGMIVGLGGKAATTSRGSSLKGFIKDECHSAVVTVKLRNRGTDAYLPGEYGDSITVERRINQDGVSSYKLKSQEGKVISTKKEDLVTILDQYNIQIDNPVSILNQDTSRCFLNSSDPKDKYKFFLKATQLEQMSNHYQQIVERKETIKDILNKKKEILPEMQATVKELEEKYKDIAQLKEIRERIKSLREELLWAHVRDKKGELMESKKSLQREEARVPKHDEKIEEQKTLLENLNKEHEEKDKKFKLVVEQVEALSETGREAATMLKKMKTEFRINQEKVRKKEREIAISSKERKQLTDRIAELKQIAIQDHQAEREAKEAELNDKKFKKQEAESKLKMSLHLKSQLEMSIKKTQEQAYKLGQEETSIKRKVDNAERQVSRLQRSRENRLNIFGSFVPTVIEKINALAKAGKFHRTPIGPLGAHISLKDKKWNVGVEKCLGNRLMLAFCCHDLHDMNVLNGVFKDHWTGPNPSIIVSRFQEQLYDVSQKRSQSKFPAVLDMLEIPNPIVANTLIDQARVESVLLIEKSADAKEEIWKRRPYGAHRAYTIVGDEVIGGRTQKYYSNSYQNAKFLTTSIEHDIKQFEKEAQQERQQLQDLRNKRTEMDRNIRSSQQELQNVKSKSNKEQDLINRLNLDIQDLLSTAEENQLPDLTALEEDLEEYEVKIADLQREVESDNQELQVQKEALQKQQDKDNEISRQKDELARSIEPFMEEFGSLEERIGQCKSDKKFYERKKAELMAKIEEVRKKVTKIDDEYQDMYDKVKDGSEIETTRTVKNLESEIANTEKRVQREEQNRGNAEEVTKRYHEAYNKYKEVCERFASFKKFHKMLEKVILRRARQFDDFRRYIVIRAKQYFTMTLSQRGYSGKLKIDHDKEMLSIQVNVEQAKGTASKDTKSLSGGERSFSTVCFIMALWEAMESPFRVLDEFDVFMDMVNRRISMEMLLKIAKEQNNRQFLLLTPQDMSNVSAGNNVRIFKMRDPERGQTVLPFRPASQT
eukprot:gene17575-9207_t